MSDEGFHEIQLSGKQLVFLFMSVVVLMVVIFLLGVDVGRGVPAGVGDTTVSVAAGAAETNMPDDGTSGIDPATSAETDLSYHDMLLEDEAVTGNPAGTETPLPAVGTAAPPIGEPTAAAPPAPAPSGDWILQMGAYSTRAVADAQVEKLVVLEVPAFVLAPVVGSPDQLFRVRVGPYPNRVEAEQVKSRLERQGFQPLITR